MKMNKKAKSVILAVAAMSLAAVGALAAFTGVTENKANTFSVVAGQDGQVTGTIVEAAWDAAKAADANYAMNLQPNATVTKDPLIQSSADYEAWAFMTVKVPTVNSITKAEKKRHPYMSAIAHNAVTFTTNTGWTLIKENASDVVGKPSEYVYGYNTKLAVAGNPGDATTTLFDTITVPDFVYSDGVGVDSEANIDITGQMIQTEGYATLKDAASALRYTVVDEFEIDHSVLESGIKDVEAKLGFELLRLRKMEGFGTNCASMSYNTITHEPFYGTMAYGDRTVAADSYNVEVGTYHNDYFETQIEGKYTYTTEMVNGISVMIANVEGTETKFWTNGTNDFSFSFYDISEEKASACLEELIATSMTMN